MSLSAKMVVEALENRIQRENIRARKREVSPADRAKHEQQVRALEIVREVFAEIASSEEVREGIQHGAHRCKECNVAFLTAEELGAHHAVTLHEQFR